MSDLSQRSAADSNSPDRQLIALAAEWQDLEDRLASDPSDADTLQARQIEIGEAALELSPTTFAGVAAKARIGSTGRAPATEGPLYERLDRQVLAEIQLVTEATPAAGVAATLSPSCPCVARSALDRDAEEIEPIYQRIRRLHAELELAWTDPKGDHDVETMLEQLAGAVMMLGGCRPASLFGMGRIIDVTHRLLAAQRTTNGDGSPLEDVPVEPLLRAIGAGCADLETAHRAA